VGLQINTQLQKFYITRIQYVIIYCNPSCNETISAQVSMRAVSDKNHVVCDCRGKITAELNEVKLELSSFREILRVLQEEILEISPSTQPTENKGIEGCENKAPYTLSMNEEWASFSSKRRKKNNSTQGKTSDS